MLPILYALTLFLSAGLLFVVQPIAGKDLLPLAGGTPAVWTTCLLFFQAVLLIGYLYADRLVRLSPMLQTMIHLSIGGLGLTAALLLRPSVEWIPEDSDYPILGLTAYLVGLVGAPFLVLSATAPLLQRWFAATGHPAGRDPYFLYAASNAGSLLGLLGYPFLVETRLQLPEQLEFWKIGYLGLMGLILLCAATVWRAGGVSPLVLERTGGTGNSHPPLADKPSLVRFVKWIALAALPSSLLLSATTHLTTDVAPVPLLWVVPLALYLTSFIIAFARWPERARLVMGRIVPMLLLFLAVALLTRATEPLLMVGSIHLATLFGVALLCHGELAADRPAKEHLTTFYLALSIGGAVGGLMNAIIAPVVFSSLGLIEYPLAVVLAGLVRPLAGGSLTPLRFGGRDLAWVIVYVGLVAGLMVFVPAWVAVPSDPDSADALLPRLLRSGLVYGLPAMVAFALVHNPLRFAICLAILFFAGRYDPGPYGDTLLISRNFFGTLRVTRSPDGQFVQLIHGTTTHGQQPTDTDGMPPPSTYYHPTGPVGRFLEKLPPERTRRVAAVGLGVGAMAAYVEPGEHWTFYEIDPAVVRIARDSGHFSFLSHTRGEVDIVLGDARRQLAKVPDATFDLIVLDAFASDAIPVHLLTVEAFDLYTRKLAPNGVLAFHLSNRYLDLPPLVARLGAAHEPPFTMKLDDDFASDQERAEGKYPSTWAILYRDPDDVGPVQKDLRFQTVRVAPGPIWTDAFSNLLSVWKKSNE